MNPADGSAIAKQVFGVDGRATPLPGYADRNYRITASRGAVFVLKVAPPSASLDRLVAENEAMQHVAASCEAVRVPTPLTTRAGATVGEIEVAGAVYLVRLITFLPGKPMAEVDDPSPDLLRGLGAALATVDRALAGFQHPATQLRHLWDLGSAEELTPGLRLLDREDRGPVERQLDRFRSRVFPQWPVLRAQVVHNDANGHNVLVSSEAPRGARFGLIDFGDVVRTALVCEPAIAMTYVMLGRPSPWELALTFLRAYHAGYPLLEAELVLIPDLIRTRLCFTLIMAAQRRRVDPDNRYVQMDVTPARALLRELARSDVQHLADRCLAVANGTSAGG